LPTNKIISKKNFKENPVVILGSNRALRYYGMKVVWSSRGNIRNVNMASDIIHYSISNTHNFTRSFTDIKLCFAVFKLIEY